MLDFSNRTFAEFFHDEFDVDIDNPCWAAQGGSKAKRLRYYLRQADRQTALDTLNALWEYRKASSVTADYPPLDDSVRVAYFRIIKRLDGKPPEPAVPTAVDPEQRVDRAATSALAARLLDVSTMDPQARGYAFEKFLKDVFDAYGMSARASFRLTGEQIDGSLMLGEQTYLLEARWRNAKVDVETLRADTTANTATECFRPCSGASTRPSYCRPSGVAQLCRRFVARITAASRPLP